MSRRIAWQLAIISLVTIALLPISSPMAKADPTPLGSVQVQRVIDGDTLKVDIAGTGETVRIIGIDTPETVHPNKAVECFGMEASNRLKGLLDDKAILLQPNPAEDRDRYGRMLRYVELDGEDIGAGMIRDGYAHSYKQYPHPRLTIYNGLEQEARAARRGLWAACDSSLEFADVPAVHPYLPAIRWGKDSGVLSGYPDGTFRPEATVNRAEFLKIVLAAKGIDATSGETTPVFSDVESGAWYAPYVRYAKDSGIIQGYQDGTFKPGQPVNFAEALKMAYVALGIDGDASAGGEWYQRYLRHAQMYSVLFETNVDFSIGMTRKDVVWIVWRLLTDSQSELARSASSVDSGPGATPVSSSPTTANSACTIKGNISSNKEKLYHVDGCRSYTATRIDETAGERWFCTEQEAQAAGWRKAGNCP
jgi:micrococcal nuclease